MRIASYVICNLCIKTHKKLYSICDVDFQSFEYIVQGKYVKFTERESTNIRFICCIVSQRKCARQSPTVTRIWWQRITLTQVIFESGAPVSLFRKGNCQQPQGARYVECEVPTRTQAYLKWMTILLGDIPGVEDAYYTNKSVQGSIIHKPMPWAWDENGRPYIS